MNTYIGIDLGTSGVKLLLVAADGRFGSESVDTDPETLAFRREEEQRARQTVVPLSDGDK